MIDKKLLKQRISGPFVRAGFTHRGQSWQYAGKDALVVVTLEKADWRDHYQLNVGIWLVALGEATFPPYNQCHLYFAAESLLPDLAELIATATDLSDGNLELLDKLVYVIEAHLIPLLQQLTDESQLRELFSQGRLEDGLVRHEARQYLSSP